MDETTAIERILAGVRSEAWESIPGPDCVSSSAAVAAFERVLQASDRESMWSSYNRILDLAGNNHAGSLDPRAPAVVRWLLEVAHIVEGWPRATALEALIDACSFEPDPTWGPIAPVPRAQVAGASDWLRALAERQDEYEDVRVAALELLDAAEADGTVELAERLSCGLVSSRRLGARAPDVYLTEVAARIRIEASR
jgi:hypothetical protein